MNNDYPHPIIAREGWTFLALALVVAVGALAAAGFWFLAAWRGSPLLFIAQFFRDPPRKVPREPDAVLSPADGKIVSVEKTRDPYLDRDALKISVFMNVFNVHSNRSPVDGTVVRRVVPRRQLRQRGARQGVARERTQRAASADRGGTRRHLRPDRRADRAAHPLLREARRCARPRPALTASSASARAWTSTSHRMRGPKSPSATSCSRPRRSSPSFTTG